MAQSQNHKKSRNREEKAELRSVPIFDILAIFSSFHFHLTCCHEELSHPCDLPPSPVCVHIPSHWPPRVARVGAGEGDAAAAAEAGRGKEGSRANMSLKLSTT